VSRTTDIFAVPASVFSCRLLQHLRAAGDPRPRQPAAGQWHLAGARDDRPARVDDVHDLREVLRRQQPGDVAGQRVLDTVQPVGRLLADGDLA
jgi:hypothetical protein